jgi:para-aminobenzoate synthetase / 4-amino-4-deoxychorismate lyase
MTSGVRAELKPGTTMSDVLRAVFPCGSVTGAPKVRAMEIIRELETAPRGVYCGALGWFSGESARLNVAIRTLEVRNHKARLHVGGGLVYDSTAQSEYDEALLKARFLTDPAPPFSLIETMRFDANGISLKDHHLDRLRKSASYFLFAFDEHKIIRGIEEATRELDRFKVYRLRLLLSADGEVSVTSAILPNARSPMSSLRVNRRRGMTVTTSSQRVNSSDRYLRHKTTRRELFDAEFAKAEEQGFGELLFLNERDELTEGSRTNLFILKDDVLLTPPLTCGLLPGVLRSDLLTRQPRQIIERILTLDDLRTADAIYVGNSLRGLIPARLVD